MILKLKKKNQIKYRKMNLDFSIIIIIRRIKNYLMMILNMNKIINQINLFEMILKKRIIAQILLKKCFINKII